MDTKPLNIKVYDCPTAIDRYTVVYLGTRDPSGKCEYVAMNHEPFHPQGFGQHGECYDNPILGNPIRFEDLPADCQKLVRQDLAEIDNYDPTP